MAICLARHGARRDFEWKERGENWILAAARPWDPPLSAEGVRMGTALGLGLKDRERKMKNMDKDVDMLKAAFRSKIGSTWLQVTAPRPNSKFNLGAARPWADVKAENSKPDSAKSESLPAFIARHVKSHTCNFYAFDK